VLVHDLEREGRARAPVARGVHAPEGALPQQLPLLVGLEQVPRVLWVIHVALHSLMPSEEGSSYDAPPKIIILVSKLVYQSRGYHWFYHLRECHFSF